MSTKAVIILLLFQLTHWLADYTHLSTKLMLDAKRLGRPLLPIFYHACVHYGLVAIVLLPFLWPDKPLEWVLLCQLQLFSHWGIDILKGRMNGWFPSLQNPANKFHWYIFGFDQLLHQVVLIIITFLAVK